MKKLSALFLVQGSILFGCFISSARSQVVPDNTLPDNTIVTPQGDVIQINGGTTRGTNLFHSFQEFNVGNGQEASFNNLDTISNILSRVTGGNISNIDGLISANGTANLFLINPAGIVFGEGAFLNVGGSFIGTTADSILFPDGVEFSATNTPEQPVLTINAPIGLSFRDNPGDIVNSSIFDDGTNLEDLVGLRVLEDRTLALIGGNIYIDGGFVSTISGRIELGSVAENSTVSITPVEKGFDFSYQDVSDFQDITLSLAAFINNKDTDPGSIELQGRNINLIEGSQIGITAEFEGQASDVNINASESLSLNGNAAEVDFGGFQTLIFIDVLGDATGEGSNINIDTPELAITNGAQITTTNDFGQGADINIDTSEIIVEKSFFTEDPENFIASGIFANVFADGTGNGGNLTINTGKLTVNEGAQISTTTIGSGNAGDLLINANESVELVGTIPGTNDSSSIVADVGERSSATGNGGNLTINTPRLVVKDGAQIGTVARNAGNGGDITINADESILLSGFSSEAELRGLGRSGIFVSVQQSLIDEETGETIPTTGNGGSVSLTTGELIVEEGALISVGTFSEGNGGNADIDVNKLVVSDGGEIGAGSLLGVDNIDTERGDGGTLNINAIESIEITGTGEINGEAVNSSIFTLAQSNGDAGDLTLTTDKLTISDGGEINTSASALGAAGNLTIRANNLDLNQGRLKAETAAGTGGNITLDIDDTITLSSESLISAAATGDANGGNINIDTSFIVASPQGNSDILANAQQGTGGRITIDAESIFGLQVRPESDSTNDIDASGGVDGQVIINTPDVDVTKGLVEVPQNVVEPEQSVAQACPNRASGTASGLIVKGKGGIPPEPTEPFIADPILVRGQTSARNPSTHYADIKPIKTSIGDILPARGVMVTESGEVILTAYPTPNTTARNLKASFNCG